MGSFVRKLASALDKIIREGTNQILNINITKGREGGFY